MPRQRLQTSFFTPSSSSFRYSLHSTTRHIFLNLDVQHFTCTMKDFQCFPFPAGKRPDTPFPHPPPNTTPGYQSCPESLGPSPQHHVCSLGLCLLPKSSQLLTISGVVSSVHLNYSTVSNIQDHFLVLQDAPDYFSPQGSLPILNFRTFF